MSKLVAYRRTSGDSKENTSLESQKARIEARCALDEHELVADFWDQESAENADNRKGFQNALKYIYANRADGLIVTKLDRFARSVLDGVRILEEFKKHGKSLICVSDPVDTTSPLGAAFFQIAMVFAELERKTISERCNSGRLARAAQLRYAGGSAPYGWRADRIGEQKMLTMDPVEQEVLGRIKSLREEDKLSYRAIAKQLTDDGIEPPRRNRQKNIEEPVWNNTSVRIIYLEIGALTQWARSGFAYNYMDEDSTVKQLRQ